MFTRVISLTNFISFDHRAGYNYKNSSVTKKFITMKQQQSKVEIWILSG